jgi:hypothetical protein
MLTQQRDENAEERKKVPFSGVGRPLNSAVQQSQSGNERLQSIASRAATQQSAS